MWQVPVVAIFWLGFGLFVGFIVGSVIRGSNLVEDEAEEEDRLSRASIAAMEAELFGAVEGSDGRHA